MLWLKIATRLLLVLFFAFATVVKAAPPAGAAAKDPRHSDATQTGDVANSDAWLFHPGDEAAWAAPGFDDSAWKVVSLQRRFQSYAPQAGGTVRWYRLHLVLDPAGPGQSLLLHVPFEYQLFLDGQLAGTRGGRFSRFLSYHNGNQIYALPAGARTVVLALRVTGVEVPDPVSGAQVLIARRGALEKTVDANRGQTLAIDLGIILNVLLGLLLGFGVLLLYRSQPDRKEYLWLGLCLLFHALYNFGQPALRAGLLPRLIYGLFCLPMGRVGDVALFEFYFRFAQVRPGRWMRVYEVTLVSAGAIVSLLYSAQKIQPIVVIESTAIASFSIAILTLILLFAWSRRGNTEAQLLIVPAVLSSVSHLVFVASGIAFAQGKAQSESTLLRDLHLGYVPLRIDVWTYTLFLITVFFILLRRFQSVTREKQQTEAEIDAARTVQTLLMPATAPPTPGFDIESVYLPARQVGGDFFHIDSAPGDGSLLIVAGDVSGKGLQAAMVVSTVLGALRNESSRDPATLLAHLNRVLYGQIGGFVTCTAVLIDADGAMRVANAGNPAPYLDGRELAVAPGIPLGIVPTMEYGETRSQLDPEHLLTFVSDGVVEAINPATRELFGFDRTQSISTRPASFIAETARAFGHPGPQADDITVLTVTRLAVQG